MVVRLKAVSNSSAYVAVASDLSNAAVCYPTNLHTGAQPVSVHLSSFRLLYAGKKIIRSMEFQLLLAVVQPVVAAGRDAVRLDCVYGGATGDVKSGVTHA